MKPIKIRGLLLVITLFASCSKRDRPVEVQQWTTHEIRFESEKTYANGYTDVDLWVSFINDHGDSLLRPAFWDGGNTWKVRFAPPDSGATWTWSSHASVVDAKLSNQNGALLSVPYRGKNKLLAHGLLRMSPGKRNVVHADGKPFLVVGDTPWSIPFRATSSQVRTYAKDRRQKGFNSALLLTLQPDKYAKGPEARNTVLGFDRAFEDLPDGHVNKLKTDYFKTLDSLVQILIDHEIAPVYAPFAHGYGWKGETAVGSEVVAEEYARYCKFLLARYGSMPALWLVNLDGNPRNAPGVKPGGEALEKWDAYGQPVGLHYSPYDDWLATWAKGDSTCCFHYNRIYQDEPWLDFQWAQTGHDGKHLFHKVERMYEAKPVKASMDGESTYEGMGGGKLGLGWWQGHDAWSQLMHGGTMGVVYGAASLWQWKVTPDEPGWPEWTNSPLSWREALDLEGSKYVAFISRAFQGFDFADMEKKWELTEGNKPLLAREGIFYISYLENGGEIKIRNVPVDVPYFWFDPKRGEFTHERKTNAEGSFDSPDTNPWVLVVGERRY
ncbi:MAG: DUF4038 domain-containing protein [Cyclobacteriaceae bacterium]